MKKPFKERKFGKLITSPVAKLLIKSLPFGIGSMAGNILDKTENSEPGQVNKEDAIPQIVKLAIYGILIYMAIKGGISWEDAEQAKNLIGT